MVRQELVDYIKQNLEAGFARPDIEQSLKAAGWADADVADTFATFAVESPAPQAEAPAAAEEEGNLIGLMVPHQGDEEVAAEDSSFNTKDPKEFLAEMQRHRDAQKQNANAGAPEYMASLGESGAQNPGGLIGLLLKTHLVKTETQAKIALVVIMLIIWALIGWMLLR